MRAYLGARWRGSPLTQEVEDAVQEVFVDCFREGGALARVDSGRPFRPFLYGVAQMVARRHEERRSRGRLTEQAGSSLEVPAGLESPSEVFDRAWARSVMEEAAARQAERAQSEGEAAQRRVELLELRFGEGLPIREIAKRWQVDSDRLHTEFARARREFRSALREVVSFHHPGSVAEVDQECCRLLDFF